MQNANKWLRLKTKTKVEYRNTGHLLIHFFLQQLKRQHPYSLRAIVSWHRLWSAHGSAETLGEPESHPNFSLPCSACFPSPRGVDPDGLPNCIPINPRHAKSQSPRICVRRSQSPTFAYLIWAASLPGTALIHGSGARGSKRPPVWSRMP